ncbi:MAG: cytochrome c oxidase subunit 3 family protein [Candidatus Binatia bacterium]
MSSPVAHVGVHEHAVHRDYGGAKIGMWLFLFTEIILFGGLFILYSAYRSKYPHEFHDAGSELNWVMGVINTAVLLTSSLSMALSITAVQKGNRRLSMLLLAVTVTLGAVFLTVKYFEWMVKIHHGLYPNGPELLKRQPGEILFFGLYFTMTGLHGVHVIAGMVVLSIMLALLARGRIRQDDYIKLENAGLYWHLVDVIWIFLLPLFYLAA